MLVKPSVTDLLTKVDNRYTLVIMVSKRARQIAAGKPTVTKVKMWKENYKSKISFSCNTSN